MKRTPETEAPTVTPEGPVPGPPDSSILAGVVAVARAASRREPGLVAVGGAALVITLLCLVAVAVRGSFIPPEGKMLDAATFSFGVAVFTLTMALILPLAGYPEKARRRWRRAYLVFPVYGLAVEPIQAFRGVDPRFTEVGTPIDVVTGIVFGVTAVLVTVVFVVLGLRFFRDDVLADRPVLRLGIRYGAVAVAISYGVGIIMSFMGGRVIGDQGNLMVSHALGVHGIQALPIVALALQGVRRAGSAAWAHIAGVAWLVACTAALVEALLGRPPTGLDVLSVLVVTGVAVWAAAGMRAFAWWRRATDG